MMSDFETNILKIISEYPGLKTKDIANKLGCNGQRVYYALTGNLREICCYCETSESWYLKENKINDIISADESLTDICSYYLNCLSLDNSNEISASLNSKNPLNYSELSSIKIDYSNNDVASLIKSVSRNRSLSAYVGYPVSIYSVKNNQNDLHVAPIFLFPVEISGGVVSVSSVPSVNMKIIAQYSEYDKNNRIYDLLKLEDELKLNDPNATLDIREIVAQLQSIRNWQWKDKLDPDKISNIPPIETITETGIYNKAIFIVTEQPPYTRGLATELANLANMDENSYQKTALYDWIHQNTSTAIVPKEYPLLEIFSMNLDQKRAVLQALNNKLTVITGPPGTGKSQVVTNFLINAAWNGKSVLFASKYHKTVDVVEARVNSIARQPIMLRLGNDGSQRISALTQLISDLFSYSADKNDHQEYESYSSLYQDKLAEYKELEDKKEGIIKRRNHVDRMEQRVCDLHEIFRKKFTEITAKEIDLCRQALKEYNIAYSAWDNTKKSFWGKLLWFVIGKKKTVILNESLLRLNNLFQKYEQALVVHNGSFLNSTVHKEICNCGLHLIDSLQTINEYKKVLNDLLTVPPLEDIDKELVRRQSDLENIAKELWNKWLEIRSLQIDAECRNEITTYRASLGTNFNNPNFIALHQKLATRFFPCWAVTSLSAKSQIPFQPGIFDFVVIDEASQCDIASVLPILYRAKCAVIIGDPKQLSPISNISSIQDSTLIQKYNVKHYWMYSEISLYETARRLAEASQIVNLRDHYRSYGDIIEFSNAEFYNGKLRIATNYGKLNCPPNIDPGIHWVDVKGKMERPTSGSAVNHSEVTKIIEEIQRLTINNNYKGSIGVITPFRAQADAIYSAISKDFKLKNALKQNDLLVDTVHKFQGDERDLIFFSPVISQGMSQSASEFLARTGNLFNVAITRARAVLIVVGNFDYCSKCGISYMEHFVEYVHKLQLNSENFIKGYFPAEREYPKVENPEQVSDWERYFYTALFDSGIQTIPQYSVDKYKLDFAIIDGERKLDIEIDGEMYHKDWNGELCYRDQLRNRRLFELGWDVKRFWVYQVRDDLQECIRQIQKWKFPLE